MRNEGQTIAMNMPSPSPHTFLPNSLRRTAAVALVVALIVAAALAIAIVRQRGVASGSGLYETRVQQTVTGQAYWNSFCPSPARGINCLPINGMTALAGTGKDVMTIDRGTRGPGVGMGISPYGNGIVELNSSNGSWLSELSIGCNPGSPFYPGSGGLVFIGCWNSTTDNTSVLVFDYATDNLTRVIPLPSNVAAFGFDPALNRVYADVENGSLVAINVSTWSIEAEQPVANEQPWADMSWSVLYDPYANVILVQPNSTEVVALNPVTLRVVSTIPIGGGPWAMTIVPSLKELYVADVGGVLAFNATTFVEISNMTISSAPCENGGAPFLTDQMLNDPKHGDVYLIGWYGCMAIINTTSGSPLPTLFTESGMAWGVYNPDTDTVWEWSLDPGYLLLSGEVIALSHSSHPVLTSLFWLPPNLGASLAIGLAVSAFGIGVWLRRRHRSPPPPVDSDVLAR